MRQIARMRKMIHFEVPTFGRVPFDLIQWLDCNSLAVVAMESAHTINLGRFDSPRQDDRQTSFLLGLVTYCYARGIFTLAGIVSVSQDRENAWPFVATLNLTHSMVRDFLRQWRQIIKQNLVFVFREAWRRRYAVYSDGMTPGFGSNFPSLSELQAMRHFVCEADDRMCRGMRWSRFESQNGKMSPDKSIPSIYAEVNCAV